MNMKNLEFYQETLIGQPASEIPPNPFAKGGRGDFWQGRGAVEDIISWLRLCQFMDNS
jgi:hypothetical protein